jgi:hypothetical protein
MIPGCPATPGKGEAGAGLFAAGPGGRDEMCSCPVALEHRPKMAT